MSAEREMTLEEWVARLPEFHLAHRQYTEIRENTDKLAAEIVRLRGEVAALLEDPDEAELAYRCGDPDSDAIAPAEAKGDVEAGAIKAMDDYMFGPADAQPAGGEAVYQVRLDGPDEWVDVTREQYESGGIGSRSGKPSKRIVYTTPPAAQVQQISAGDAVFAFSALLTSLPHVVPFGSAAWATPGAKLAAAFNEANGLAVSRDFPGGLRYPKIEGELLEVIQKAAKPEATHPAAGDKVRELLREVGDTVEASTVEDGISENRRRYRVELAARIKAALAQPQEADRG